MVSIYIRQVDNCSGVNRLN